MAGPLAQDAHEAQITYEAKGNRAIAPGPRSTPKPRAAPGVAIQLDFSGNHAQLAGPVANNTFHQKWRAR